jgi:hypothetical protein
MNDGDLYFCEEDEDLIISKIEYLDDIFFLLEQQPN